MDNPLVSSTSHWLGALIPPQHRINIPQQITSNHSCQVCRVDSNKLQNSVPFPNFRHLLASPRTSDKYDSYLLFRETSLRFRPCEPEATSKFPHCAYISENVAHGDEHYTPLQQSKFQWSTSPTRHHARRVDRTARNHPRRRRAHRL